MVNILRVCGNYRLVDHVAGYFIQRMVAPGFWRVESDSYRHLHRATAEFERMVKNAV